MRSSSLLLWAAAGMLAALPAQAQYRYLILNEPVDAPRAMDPRTLEYTEDAQVLSADGMDDAAPQAQWTPQPKPEPPTPGPQPDATDPYAPRFEHTLPWPEVLDQRPAGPPPVPEREVASAPQQALPASSAMHAPVPQVPVPTGPEVQYLPDETAGFEFGDEPAPEAVPAPGNTLAWAPEVTSPPSEPVYWEIAVVVDGQTRGYAVVPMDDSGQPMLTVEALEALRLPVPATAVRSGYALPADLSQSFDHDFDPGTATLTFESLAPPELHGLNDSVTPAPSAEPDDTTAPPHTTRPPLSAQAPCTPRMRRGRATQDCL